MFYISLRSLKQNKENYLLQNAKVPFFIWIDGFRTDLSKTYFLSLSTELIKNFKHKV